MTKQEIQNQYQALVAKTGDLYFKINAVKQQLAQFEKQMDEYQRTKNELEQAYAGATDEPAVVESETAQPE